MKRLIFILAFFSIFGCQQGKTYYAYEEEATHTYAVMVVSKGKGLIQYQSSSDRYDKKYIYINGQKPPFLRSDIVIDDFFEIQTIDRTNKWDVCPSIDGGKVVAYTPENDRIIFQSKGEIECLDKLKVQWFPPYMIQVEKIDYDKFPKDIKKSVIAISKNKPFRKVVKALPQ